MTKREAAERVLGNATWDSALPQQWVDAVVSKTECEYNDVLAHFVWSYDHGAGIFGRPCALTSEANMLLERINTAFGSSFPLTPAQLTV